MPRCWPLLVVLVFASSFLGAQQEMQVASSVPLPEIWKRMDYARSSCGGNGDFIAFLAASSAAELPHELVHIGANGAMLGYFDLHRTQGFENGAVKAVALDAAGRIVLLVRNMISSRTTKTDAEGRPRGVSFRMDRNSWVLTVDDKGGVLNKFSFDERLVMPLKFALFRSGNVLVSGDIQGQHGKLAPGAVIFSPAGVMLANLKLPIAAGGGPAAGSEVAQLQPLSGTADEVFIAHSGTEPYLLKVSADGTVGQKVMLPIPEDERAFVQKIAGHRAMASIAQAKLPASAEHTLPGAAGQKQFLDPFPGGAPAAGPDDSDHFLQYGERNLALRSGLHFRVLLKPFDNLTPQLVATRGGSAN